MMLALLLALSLAYAAPAISAPKAAVNMPPAVVLNYSITARQSGITLSGRSRLLWQADGASYLTTAETSAMLLGKILDERSEGTLDAGGLAPAAYTEKRFRKSASTTSFDRSARLIRFGETQQTQPLQGGEQDRASAIWQLISVMRAEKKAIKPGAAWRFVVAGQRDADPWTFIVKSRERITTALGSLDTLHIVRTPPPDAQARRLDIWLAPSVEWYPVRLRFEDSNGEYIEQLIESITKQ
ncbi:DUF3108 domain-containing protein [Lacisediminimonas sp.]|uniref:DUF3108 domain-containing protein n=1 Tax=Lacisediminimonas sp. TaxID=3060582 RepID=UPI0027180460|nr:DUF3108 domain-containing protein [Lacisediminimonas sp.]MDO8300525.1 DUF3108 domain-containing protein [Lacisediminimonas sp.]